MIKNSLKRYLLIVAFLAGSVQVLGLLFLQWSGLAWGDNIDTLQKTFLISTLAFVVAGLIAVVFGSLRGATIALLSATFCLGTSFYWASGIKDRKTAAMEKSAASHNRFALENAMSKITCNNGETAVVTVTEVSVNGGTRKAMRLEILSADETEPSRILTSSSGLIPPDPAGLRSYLAQHPGVICTGDRYSTLDQLFSEIADHYRRERPAYYPDDPLYAADFAKIALDATPVDPLDLLLKIEAVNQTLQERSENWASYSFQIQNQKFDRHGVSLGMDTERVDGDRLHVIWHDPAVNFERAEVLVNGDLHAYLDTGSNVRPVHLKHVLHAQLRGKLFVEGHQNQGITAWHMPVIHMGRHAHRYAFHSTTAASVGDWTRTYEFIVDEETGLVLETRITNNGTIERLQERQILGAAPEKLSQRVETLKLKARLAEFSD